MYIDVVPNRNSPPAILLREARRQGKRVIKVTLAHLCPLPPPRLDILRRALKGELDCPDPDSCAENSLDRALSWLAEQQEDLEQQLFRRR